MTEAVPGPDEILGWAREALRTEADALERTISRLDEVFAKAVVLLLGCQGKVVVTGLGKSGHIARKMASTLSSTGTSSFYLHPSEALHGDFGMVGRNDVLIAIAFGGETAEVVEVARYARRIEAPLISITGKSTSTLAQLSNIVLDGSVAKEACPLNLAPTSSSTVALAIGDALAVCLMKARGFDEQSFAEFHPGGSIGRRFSKVREHMFGSGDLVLLQPGSSFHDILQAVTMGNLGIAAVVDGQRLAGAVTDGDVRRSLLAHGANALTMKAAQLMNNKPKTIGPDVPAMLAVQLMEASKITSVFVVDPDRPEQLLGIVRMHDLLAAKIV